MNMSLMAILRDDPDIAKRLEQGTKEVRENKERLMANALEYSDIYSKEIEEGTKKRQLLLEYGRRQGKGESEVLAEYGKFIPSRSTPIMNFLYFLMRDGDHPDWLGIHKELYKDYGFTQEQVYATPEQNNIVQHVSQAVTEDELDQIFGILVHEDEKYINVQEPKDSDYYIYGNCSHEMFSKIKKLKALSKSSNENEAFLAYRLALKLCNKFGLEFDKIPCIVQNEEK